MDWLEKLKQLLERVYPYVVLLAASVSHASSIGFHYGMLGSFTMAQMKHFNISIYQSSWSGAVHLATFLIMSPAAAGMTRCFSLRFIQTLGGAALIAGMGLCAICTELWQVLLLFGVLSGFGMSLVRTSSSAILPHHFGEDMIDLARAGLMIGFTLGMTVFPVILGELFADNNFASTMVTIAKIMVIHILCGLTYHQTNEKQRGLDYIKEEEHDISTICPTIPKILKNIKVWSYLWAGIFRKFGLTAFFTLLSVYVVKDRHLSAANAAQGRMTLGCAATVGVVAIRVTHQETFDRLIPHTILPIIYGTTMIFITKVENEISFSMLMTLFGLTYGMQVANTLAVARELGGGMEMMLIFALELVLEGLASLAGSPTTSYIMENVDMEIGIYFAATCCIVGGICITPIFLVECINERQVTEDERTAEISVNIQSCNPKLVKYKHVFQQDESSELQPLTLSDSEDVR